MARTSPPLFTPEHRAGISAGLKARAVMTVCGECGMSILRFPRNRKYCDACSILVNRRKNTENMRRYSAQNREAHNAKLRARGPSAKAQTAARQNIWRAKHKERLLIDRRRLYTKNAERERARSSVWAKANPDKVRAMGSAWKLKNPEKVSALKRRRYAREKGALGSFTAEQFRALCEEHDWKCAYCLKPVTIKTATADHVVPLIVGGSNEIENISPACRNCNSSKGRKPLDKFLTGRQECHL